MYWPYLDQPSSDLTMTSLRMMGSGFEESSQNVRTFHLGELYVYTVSESRLKEMEDVKGQNMFGYSSVLKQDDLGQTWIVKHVEP